MKRRTKREERDESRYPCYYMREIMDMWIIHGVYVVREGER